jgi:uncharacterized protein (PEP-CTERM system associated)
MAKSPNESQQGDAANKRIVHRNIKWVLRLATMSPALFGLPALSAQWDVVPELSVVETYTDNVSLVPDAIKQAEWVTQIIPAISIAARGDRLRLNANYAPELVYNRWDIANNEVFQRLYATGNAELVEQLLFVDFGANVDQHNISLQGPITISNVNSTGNRTTVEAYSASPYVRRDFGSEVQAEARYTYTIVNSNDTSSALSNSVADRINLRLANGPAYKLLTWDFNYGNEATDYDTGQRFTSEVTRANATRLISPTVRLLVQGGYESYQTGGVMGIVIPASEGPLWSVGLDWEPSPVTHLTVTAGQRFYGDAYSLRFKHRTRLTTWSIEYSQDVTTTRSEFFVPATTTTTGYLNTLFAAQITDPVARQKAVEDFVARTGLPPGLAAPINVFTTQVFLQKTWQASAGILGIRNILIANVFKYTTEGLVGDLVLPNAPNTSIQTGTSVQWNWRLTERNTWNLGGAFARNETPSLRQVDNLTYIGMGITRQLLPRVFASLNYRRQQNDSNVSGLSYTENAILASIRKRF